MAQRKKVWTIILAFAFTSVVMRTIIGFLAGDFAYSVIPGWHTIIYPPEMTLTVLTTILLAMTVVVVVVFRLIIKIVQAIWAKLSASED